MTVFTENSRSAFSRAHLPICSLSALSSMSWVSFAARLSLSLMGIRKPLTPSSTVSLQPMEFVVTMGRPMAQASMSDLGTPSR